MHGTPIVGWLLVALSAATAALCLLRGGAREEAATGAGMAVMAVPLSAVDRWAWDGPVLTAGFAAVFTWVVLRDPAPPSSHGTHRGHHALCAAAMVYMAAAMSVPASGAWPASHSAHAGHASGAGAPLLTGLLLLYFAGYVIRTGVRMIAAVPAPGAAAAGGGAPAFLGAWPARPAQRRRSVQRPHRPGRLQPLLRSRPVRPGPVPARPPAARLDRVRHAPEVAAACRVSMGLAMCAMLISM